MVVGIRTAPCFPECHFPVATSQDWLLINLEMGKGHKEKPKGEQGQHLGHEFGREVRGTTAGIFSRKRTLFERLVLIFCFQVLN